MENIEFFSNLKYFYLKTSKGFNRYKKAGSGPKLLILHENPKTYLMWQKVVPKLVNNFIIICLDTKLIWIEHLIPNLEATG